MERMIHGNLSSPTPHMAKALLRALKNLSEEPLMTLKEGSHPLKDGTTLIIGEYMTMPAEKKLAERHEKNIDIHYVISGEEHILIGFQNERNKLHQSYSAENDCERYEHVCEEIDLHLREGMFTVLFTPEIHRAGIGDGGKVRKAVLKVPLSYLDEAK